MTNGERALTGVDERGVPENLIDAVNRPTFMERHEPAIYGGGFILLLLCLWEAVPYVVELSKGMKLFFTTPSQIGIALFELYVLSKADPVLGTIWEHLYSSSVSFTIGLILAVIVALPLGLALGRSRIVDAMVDPFITAFNATPRLVFLPLVLIWLGIGLWSVVAIVFMGAVFPLLINTYAGVKNADRLLINVIRSFGANEWQVNKMVVLPNSLPFIIAGLRLAIGRAILGVVVAEFFGGAEKGLGKMMVQAAQGYTVDILFAGLITFMVLSLIMTTGVKILETRLSRWRPPKVKTY